MASTELQSQAIYCVFVVFMQMKNSLSFVQFVFSCIPFIFVKHKATSSKLEMICNIWKPQTFLFMGLQQSEVLVGLEK